MLSFVAATWLGWPLLAAGLDFGTIIALVIGLVIWIVNQINKANEEAKKKQPPPQPPQDRPRPAQNANRPRGQQSSRSTAKPRSPVAREPEPTEAVAAHVRKHLNTQEFEQRSGSLGKLDELDDTVDEHVEQAFGNEVGTFKDEGVSTEADSGGGVPVTAAAAGVAEMFTDPDRLRNAIILQEILRAPAWD